MTTTITTTQAQISVSSPYNAVFIEKARRYGGKWSAGAWHFDVLIESKIRQLCLEIYGTDGFITDLCTVEVSVNENCRGRQEPIELNGRVIAKASHRDSGATIGEGVTVLEGGFSSGGSSKNWATTVNPGGAKVLIRNFSRIAAQKGEWEDFTVKIIEDREIDLDSLRSEKERLLARVAEIEELLEQ